MVAAANFQLACRRKQRLPPRLKPQRIVELAEDRQQWPVGQVTPATRRRLRRRGRQRRAHRGSRRARRGAPTRRCLPERPRGRRGAGAGRRRKPSRSREQARWWPTSSSRTGALPIKASMPRNAGPDGLHAKQLTAASAAMRSARRAAARNPAGPPRSWATRVTSRNCSASMTAVTASPAWASVGGVDSRSLSPLPGASTVTHRKSFCRRSKTSRQTKLQLPT